jgi:hypothetical protein
MKNSNVPEKSRGVVLFAYNTDAVDYVAIANKAARLIKHTLDLPTTIITDSEVVNNFKNTRVGYANQTPWRNGGRYHAYELSPYDETILLDSDYLQLDRSLLTILDTTQDYRLIHNNHSPRQSMSGNMGELSLDYVWATAVTFKRTEKTKLLFELVGRIQRNYGYYQKLYQITARNFRNDYAFAIANNILSGYTTDKTNGVPWTMLTFDRLISQIDIMPDKLIVREEAQAYVIPRQNIHIIDKDYLQSAGFSKFVDDICQE